MYEPWYDRKGSKCQEWQQVFSITVKSFVANLWVGNQLNTTGDCVLPTSAGVRRRSFPNGWKTLEMDKSFHLSGEFDSRKFQKIAGLYKRGRRHRKLIRARLQDGNNREEINI